MEKEAAPSEAKELFKKLIDEHSDYFLSYAQMKVDSKQDAEDLVQEMFLSGYKSYAKFKSNSSIKTWLTSILKNKIADYYRKKARTPAMSNYLSETEEQFEGSFFNKDNHGRWEKKIRGNMISEATDAQLLSQEFQQTLKRCLDKLPAKLRMVFVSKYLDDKKTEEICKDFNISASNYWTIAFRSRTLLRSCLERSGIKPSS